MKIYPVINSINYNLSEDRKKSFHNVCSVNFNGRQKILKTIQPELGKKSSDISKILPKVLQIASILLVGGIIITKFLSKDKNDITEQKETKNELSKEEKYIKATPEREAYTKYLENFPSLHKMYTYAVSEHLKDPANKETAERLNTAERVFENLYKEDEKLKILNKKYFEVLESKYSDNLEGVFDAITQTLNKNGTVYSFMNCLLNDKVSQTDIDNYKKQDLLTFEDFIETHDILNKYSMQSLNLLRKNGHLERFNLERFKSDKDNPSDNNFIIRVQFKEEVPLQEKLKDVARINEIFYGPLNTEQKTELRPKRRFKNELIKYALNDTDLSCIYNILKFIEPDKTLDYIKSGKLTKKVKTLTSDDKEFAELKEFIISKFRLLTFENKNLRVLYNLANSTDTFSDTLLNNHAKIRFLGRLVLNRMCPPEELKQRASKTAKILDEELNFRLNNGCKIFPYLNSFKGIAPSLYLGKTSLGSFIKVTLDKEGHFQTIYQDVPEKLRIKP